MRDRSGKRKTRDQISIRRPPTLGYYVIVTDTKETEKNYMEGLRKTIPQELQRRIAIKVIKTDTANLLDEAIRQASLHDQFGQLWIVFDRDQVKDFDKMIAQAREKDVCVGWSNPCFEIWLHAYFGKMPVYSQPPEQASVACCTNFGKTYQKFTGQEYEKNKAEIYQKLCAVGDEVAAFRLAERRYAQQLQKEKKGKTPLPSQMGSCTTVHRLVKEITEKIRIDES